MCGTYTVTLRGFLANHCCSGKAISIAYSELCFKPYSSSMQYASAILASVTYPHSARFPTLSHKLHDFQKKIIEYKTCFDFPYNICFKTYFIPNRTENGMEHAHVTIEGTSVSEEGT
jgi:hypothetical protein